MTGPLEREAALTPLREALVGHARAQAAALRTSAEDTAAHTVETARAQAESILAEARAHGAAEAAMVMTADRARARRAARAVVLAAQRTASDELRAIVTQDVRRLLAAPENRKRVSHLVLEQLGPAAVTHDLPDGGVLGQAPDGRVIDASVPALVERAFTEFDVSQLWSDD